jgi:hypothetical protein
MSRTIESGKRYYMVMDENGHTIWNVSQIPGLNAYEPFLFDSPQEAALEVLDQLHLRLVDLIADLAQAGSSVPLDFAEEQLERVEDPSSNAIIPVTIGPDGTVYDDDMNVLATRKSLFDSIGLEDPAPLEEI